MSSPYRRHLPPPAAAISKALGFQLTAGDPSGSRLNALGSSPGSTGVGLVGVGLAATGDGGEGVPSWRSDVAQVPDLSL